MTSFIIPLAEATALDAERIGPKAANLAALARAMEARHARPLRAHGARNQRRP